MSLDLAWLPLLRGRVSTDWTASAYGGAVQGSASGEIAYETVQPNGPGCEPICTQGDLTVVVGDLVPPTCESLDVQFNTGLAEAKECTDATECGQTAKWGSCGCTRDHVLRLDADAAALDALWTGPSGRSFNCRPRAKAWFSHRPSQAFPRSGSVRRFSQK